MGMFDTIYMDGKCPNCGTVEERDFQTKDLENCLTSYKIGDDLSKFNIECVEAIATCHNEECAFLGNIEDILNQGTPSGFDFMWSCKIKLDNNKCITNEICDIKILRKIPDNWEDIIKYRFGDYWNFLLEKYKGDKKLAVDRFGHSKNRRRFIVMIRKMDYERLTYSDSVELLYNEEYRKKRKRKN